MGERAVRSRVKVIRSFVVIDYPCSGLYSTFNSHQIDKTDLTDLTD